MSVGVVQVETKKETTRKRITESAEERGEEDDGKERKKYDC